MSPLLGSLLPLVGSGPNIVTNVRGILSAPDSDGTSAELLFPDLQQLVLQPNVIGGASTDTYTSRIDDLAALAPRPLVVLPLREHVGQPDERAVTKARWMDRIAGGRGCWEPETVQVGLGASIA